MSIVIRCLEGKVEFETIGASQEIINLAVLYLNLGGPHSLIAIEKSHHINDYILTNKKTNESRM